MNKLGFGAATLVPNVNPMRPLALALLLSLGALANAQAPAAKSAVLVTRSGAGAADFAKLLSPRLEAEIAAAGLAVTSAAPAADAEEQARQARARGADLLVELQVVSFSRSVTEAFGQERRRLAATAGWKATALGGDLAAAGAGRATESSAGDAALPEAEQADALAEALARALAKELAAKLAAAPAKPVASASVTFRLVADTLALPDIEVDAEGRLTRTESAARPALSGFTVEVDGVTQGVAGESPIKVAPGIREVVVRRSGFETWSRKVELRDGLALEVAATPTAESLARVRAHASFLSGLANGARLNAAEVERVRGAAEALRNSGFKVNVKVDAKELPETVVAPAR